jgi:tripartite-type tricarboxylate transporter receptor subunit TctC
MRIARRTLLAGLLATPALAQARPMQIIVGYPPGGGSDVLARVLAEAITRGSGRAVVVRNVAGAGGQIAATALLREPPEGSPLLAINHPDLTLAIQRGTAGLRAADFQAILVDVQDPRVMLVRRDGPIRSFAAFVEQARARPGTLSVSVTAGSAQELIAKWLFARLGIEVILAGYRGGAEASNALLSGDVTANIGDDFARFNLRDSTTALFIGAARPSPRWPEAPTLAAALAPFNVALPSPDFLARFGIYAVPARLKAEDGAGYQRLQAVLLQAHASAEYRAYAQRSRFEDLLIGKPGEAYEAAFAADGAAIAQLG